MKLICFFFSIVNLSFIVSICCVSPSGFSYFPDSIPSFEVRRDIYTGKEVQRGLLHLIGEEKVDAHTGPRVTYDEFKKSLMCSPTEPDLDGSRGSLSLISLARSSLSRKAFERMCAHSETNCKPWNKCDDSVKRLKNGHWKQCCKNEIRYHGHGFGFFRLYRIINGSFYIDWYWGTERLKANVGNIEIFKFVVRSISDLSDNVFFIGGETSALHHNFPFPLFSSSPAINNNDIPMPWNQAVKQEMVRYKIASENRNFSDTFYQYQRHSVTKWEDRMSKAAWFCTIKPIRQIVYDQAMLRPDLFDASFTGDDWHSWNPESDEFTAKEKDAKSASDAKPGDASYILPLRNKAHKNNPHDHKYIIVIAGHDGLATADRLQHLLAYSGAVILLQETSFSYHFTSRLKPWVHYVPLSFNTADAIAKVEWLQQHDKEAQRIAQNGLNFGKSYLRMEDMYCYIATAFKSIEDIMNGSTALIPFEPKKLRPF